MLLPGRGPQKKYEENARRILEFLRNESWTEATIVQELLELKTSSAARRILVKLARQGGVKEHRIELTSVPRSQTVSVWAITKAGHAEVNDDGVDKPLFYPSRLSPRTLPHKLGLQLLRIRLVRAGWTDWTKASAEKATPDAIATDPDGKRVAIEYELHVKTLKRYRTIVQNYRRAMRAGLIDRVEYHAPDYVCSRLRRILTPEVLKFIVVAGDKKRLTDDDFIAYRVISQNAPPK